MSNILFAVISPTRSIIDCSNLAKKVSVCLTSTCLSFDAALVSVCGVDCPCSVCSCVSVERLLILVSKSEECRKIEEEKRIGFLLKIFEIFTFIYKDLI
jgi:hypothetical protein